MRLATLSRLMADHGVRRLFIKRLAPNDNSKNQVYFGPGFGALNIFPNRGVHPDRSGQNTFKAALDFAWLDEAGQRSPAPHAQLILYPEYPEVRFSGFLRGSAAASGSLMVSRDPGRILFLGVTDDGAVLGHVVAANSSVAREFDRSPLPTPVGVFYEMPITSDGLLKDGKRSLLRELRRIHGMGWIDSKRLLSDGALSGCEAQNCGGYTLEAELGVRPNGIAEPDYMGWEVKQHGVSSFSRIENGVITLMTPEPTLGYYKTHGPEAFVRKFGYRDRAGRPDRLNFGGVHRVDVRHPMTELTLKLVGYDAARHRIADVNGGVALLTADGGVAAKWRYSDLMQHWKKKHALAAYIPSMHRENPGLQYRFGDKVRLGEGTEFSLFLLAMERGAVYYDPGIKLEGASGAAKIKRRSQFRVKSSDLSTLYNAMNVVSL